MSQAKVDANKARKKNVKKNIKKKKISRVVQIVVAVLVVGVICGWLGYSVWKQYDNSQKENPTLNKIDISEITGFSVE